MDLSKISIAGLEVGGMYRVRVRYSPYALFDLCPDGIHRWKGVDPDLPFIGDNTAVKVLRQYCTYFPQGYWDKKKNITQLAHNGTVVEMGGVCYFAYVDGATPYFMASLAGRFDNGYCYTIAQLTDDGLRLCKGVSKEVGIAIEGEYSGHPRVWSVK